MDDSREFMTVRERARPELLWYLRHEKALGRWPVIDEPWAQRIERRRRAGHAGGDTADRGGTDR